jgi:hypothetical protein
VCLSKRDRAGAEKAYAAVRAQGVSHKDLVTKKAQHSDACRKAKAEGKYVPWPAKWLESKGWTEEYDEPRASKPAESDRASRAAPKANGKAQPARAAADNIPGERVPASRDIGRRVVHQNDPYQDGTVIDHTVDARKIHHFQIRWADGETSWELNTKLCRLSEDYVLPRKLDDVPLASLFPIGTRVRDRQDGKCATVVDHRTEQNWDDLADGEVPAGGWLGTDEPEPILLKWDDDSSEEGWYGRRNLGHFEVVSP